jgi:cGMP-dependent protein kinase
LKIIKKLSQTGEKIEFLAENSEKKLVKVTSISRNLVIHPYKKYLVEELQVLQIVDHFLIPQYLSYEKNDLGILIFSEYTSGNLLLKHLQSQGHNFEYLYKFYFACLVDIVAYLSENHVVLRNMTSESFIIDSDGYAVLNDLALSKIVHDRTHTILGNPYYLPPEAITEKGINSSSMFWIIGVILYEMICRVVPFGDKDDDPYSIYEKILRKRLIYNDFADEFFESKRIIEQLLCKNPDSRMIGGPQKFKLQSYFSCIDWNLFRLKKVKPPVSPSILVQNAISSEEVELFPLKDADFLPDWHEGF